MTKRDTQNRTILRHLKEKGSISPAEAWEKYKIMRLGARIWDLRHGKLNDTHYLIETLREGHERGTHARYKMGREYRYGIRAKKPGEESTTTYQGKDFDKDFPVRVNLLPQEQRLF